MSVRDSWGTPQALFDVINDEFRFTLDVCASAQNTKCHLFLSEEMDGLRRTWGSVNWCNPPYSDIPPWIEKAYQEMTDCGNTTVLLLPVDPSVGWWSKALFATEIRFLVGGRVQFVPPPGVTPSSNKGGSCLAIFRPRPPQPYPCIGPITTYWDWKVAIALRKGRAT